MSKIKVIFVGGYTVYIHLENISTRMDAIRALREMFSDEHIELRLESFEILYTK